MAYAKTEFKGNCDEVSYCSRLKIIVYTSHRYFPVQTLQVAFEDTSVSLDSLVGHEIEKFALEQNMKAQRGVEV
jgi:hypothetical protein